MALIMNQNLYALNSQHYLGASQNALGKSIERLSSGLKINHASDDASGMAISEKMRGQISGLKRASMNAQDGISYLQTAEGAMEQTSSILQRMRELAVQASNGIYTTNDRAEIQKEVDQLKSEIDRISTSTEFNTRKPINGDATAIWSSDTDLLEAIVRGPVQEGNYEITMSVRPGKAEILKSSIMTLSKNATSTEISPGSLNTTNVGFVSDPKSMPPTNGNDYNVDITSNAVDFESTTTNSAVTGVKSTHTEGLTIDTDDGTTAITGSVGTAEMKGNATAGTAAALTPAGAFTGYVKIDFLTSETNLANLTAADFKVTLIDAYTGEEKVLKASELTYDGADLITINGVATFQITSTETAQGDAAFFSVTGEKPAEATAGDAHNIKIDNHVEVRIPTSEKSAELYIVTFDTGTGSFVKDKVALTLAATPIVGSDVFDIVAAKPTANVVGKYGVGNSAWTTNEITANTVSNSGYMEVELLSSGDSANGAEFRVRFIDAKDGVIGNWQTFNNTDADKLMVNYSSNGYTMDLEIDINVGMGGGINKGDKLLLAVSQDVPLDTIGTGGGTITITDGPDEIKDGPRIVYTEESSLTPTDNGDHILDTKDITVHYADMDSKTGNVNIGNITLNFKESPRVDPSNLSSLAATSQGSFKFSVVGGGGIATTATKLRDIKLFTDADGNNIFENKQELTIYANGKKAIIHLEGNDTIATLVEKLNKAIVKDLDMGSDDPQVNANLVKYITTPSSSGRDTVQGTMIIQTALTGENSELAFVGNQALIDGLGLAQIQKPTNNESIMTVRDAHTGNLIGTEVTGNDRIYGIIEGVEVIMDSRAGLNSRWNVNTNEVEFYTDPTTGDKKYYFHLVDNRTSLQIGANKGQDIDVSIPQLDLKGLGLENVTMVSQSYAKKAIGKIDEALTKVVSARATVGAQVSRLEHTVENLSTARQNLISAESRIRDLDVAEESTNFARNQILVQSGVSMLAQANQLPQIALQLIQG